MSADRTANGIFAHVENIVETFDLENKFVAQTYDEAAVMSGHLDELQEKVKSKYPARPFLFIVTSMS